MKIQRMYEFKVMHNFINVDCGAKRNKKIGTESGTGLSTKLKGSASKEISAVFHESQFQQLLLVS